MSIAVTRPSASLIDNIGDALPGRQHRHVLRVLVQLLPKLGNGHRLTVLVA